MTKGETLHKTKEMATGLVIICETVDAILTYEQFSLRRLSKQT
jgi:hypothetical protein